MRINYYLTAAGIILLLITNGCIQPEEINSSTAGNSAPEIKSIFVDPLSLKIGETAIVRVTAEDPDGDELAYEWATALGDIIGGGYEVKYTAAYCCVGINIINVSVSDYKGAKTTQSISVEIIP